MLLICDSGSTKADWILIQDNEGVYELRTEGLNPVFVPENDIREKLKAEKKLVEIFSSVTELNFFGSGCGNEEGKGTMLKVLREFIPTAAIHVENDLMAAAIATCGNQHGIVSILGTGSNCCFYDGQKIHRKNFGAGFILGDEAGGDYFGKNFLRAYLYQQLPKEISDDFYKEYHHNFETIIESVYRKPQANLFLSSFMSFILKHRTHSWVKDFFKSGIDDFFSSNIKAFEQWKSVPLHFVGSVAAELEELIREKGKNEKASVGKVIKEPKNELINFFLKKEKQLS